MQNNLVKGYTKKWLKHIDTKLTYVLELEKDAKKFLVTLIGDGNNVILSINSSLGNSSYVYDSNFKLVNKSGHTELKSYLRIMFNVNIEKEIESLFKNDRPILRDYWIVGLSNGSDSMETSDAKLLIDLVNKNKNDIGSIFNLESVYLVNDIDLQRTIDKYYINSNMNGKEYFCIFKFNISIPLSIMEDTLHKINKMLPDRKDFYKDKSGNSAIDIRVKEKKFTLRGIVDGKPIMDTIEVEKSLLKNTKYTFYIFDDYFLNDEVYEKIKYLV